MNTNLQPANNSLASGGIPAGATVPPCDPFSRIGTAEDGKSEDFRTLVASFSSNFHDTSVASTNSPQRTNPAKRFLALDRHSRETDEVHSAWNLGTETLPLAVSAVPVPPNGKVPQVAGDSSKQNAGAAATMCAMASQESPDGVTGGVLARSEPTFATNLDSALQRLTAPSGSHGDSGEPLPGPSAKVTVIAPEQQIADASKSANSLPEPILPSVERHLTDELLGVPALTLSPSQKPESVVGAEKTRTTTIPDSAAAVHKIDAPITATPQAETRAARSKAASAVPDISLSTAKLPVELKKSQPVSPQSNLDATSGIASPDVVTSPEPQTIDFQTAIGLASTNADPVSMQNAPASLSGLVKSNVLLSPAPQTLPASPQGVPVPAITNPAADISRKSVNLDPAGHILSRVLDATGKRSADFATPIKLPSSAGITSAVLKKDSGRSEPSAKTKDHNSQREDISPKAGVTEAPRQTEKQEAPASLNQPLSQGKTATAAVPRPSPSQGTPTKADIGTTQASPENLSDPDGGDSGLPQLHSMVSAARLMQGVNQSEFRIGMQTRELGSIDIRTSVAAHTFTAQIFVEHSDVARSMTGELPSLYARLADHQVPAGPIQIHSTAFSTSAGFDQEARQQSSGMNDSAHDLSGFPPETKLAPIFEAIPVSDRLDIRI